ncbi:hypothetical protein TH53_07500 [Pedobacter lusitanus]|uniref:phosphoglycolate phosphatase n=1 Tax=Pedobacter lusitanus TaxID=1503925 RepID=A0A0D0GKM1_9SPHI|nr:HAD hydrolase-like protein [Pedobacter lusitanus]KIO77762.1 hypothetical protein TH53_07500 [Pedobacter lusitanus]
MRYIIFDIDGTLTDTTAIDDHCFTRALESTFNFSGFETDYGHYENTTDSGIIHQLFMENHHRTYTAEERDRFIYNFCALLKDAYAVNNECMKEIPKAGKILNALCEQDGISVGLATGGWRESALFKLSCAGITTAACAAASFAQDARARRDIITCTITKMNALHGIEMPLSEIIYVGDGKWDYQATQQLGIQFIGIENKKLEHLADIIKISDYDELHLHLA